MIKPRHVKWVIIIHGPFARYVKLGVTHAPGMPVSFEVGGGKNVPGIPGACATHNCRYLRLYLNLFFYHTFNNLTGYIYNNHIYFYCVYAEIDISCHALHSGQLVVFLLDILICWSFSTEDHILYPLWYDDNNDNNDNDNNDIDNIILTMITIAIIMTILLIMIALHSANLKKSDYSPCSTARVSRQHTRITNIILIYTHQKSLADCWITRNNHLLE